MKKIHNTFLIFLLFYSFSLNALMLDDMEDNNDVNNWGGYWYTYDDLNNSGDSYVVPWSEARWNAVGLPPEPFFMQSPGRTGIGYAARMTGYVTTTYQHGFVGMGTSFIDPKGPVDLSTCTGFSFWYKGDGRTYRVKILSSHPNFVLGDGDNHYGYTFTSATDWTQLALSMTSLTQEPFWGSSVNLSDALSMATDIQFQTVDRPQSSIELWVDEIDIYGCSSYPSSETPTFTPTPTSQCPAWFGKKIQGDYSYDFSNYFNACKYRLLEDGTINSISVNFASTSGGQARVALYTDNAGTPGNLIVESASEVISASGWHTFDVADTVLTAGIYWLAIQTESGVILSLDTIAASNEIYYAMPYGSFPAVAGEGSVGDGAYDMYVDYAPLVCPSPTTEVTPIVICDCPGVMGKQYDGGISSEYITGYMSMNWYGMGQDGIAQSISVRVESGSGNMKVALYDDVAGEPGRLLVESASTAVSVGWNEIDINDIALEAGKVYWIAMQSDSSSVYIGRDVGSSGDERYMAYSYKQFPEISLLMNSYLNNWDIRVNYCPLTCPPTPTLTPTETEVVTDTETPTITETIEVTDTYTLTETPIVTETFTLTATLTVTETAEIIETYTVTSTLTSTPTPTITYTNTPDIQPSMEKIVIYNLDLYPNPVNPNKLTHIKFNLSKDCRIKLIIYTTAFRLIKEMDIGNCSVGENIIQMASEIFVKLANGIYFYVIFAEDNAGKKVKSEIKKFIVLK